MYSGYLGLIIVFYFTEVIADVCQIQLSFYLCCCHRLIVALVKISSCQSAISVIVMTHSTITAGAKATALAI